MTVSGPPQATTTVAAVIGSPIAHSLSPALHNAAFAAAGLDWVYVAHDVPADGGAAAVGAMRALGLGGLSVTMPLKAEVAAAVDRLEPAAERLGAVNCVYWDGESLVGANTDGAGLLAAVDESGVEVADRSVLVVGAGGAARAAILAFAGAGGHVAVANRSEENRARAVTLAEGVTAATVEDAGDFDIVVNATPIGMGGSTALPVPADALGPDQSVVDLVYSPARTPLLVAAERCGARPVGGIGMLVHQAALAFSRWTGVKAPVEAMREVVA